MGKASNLFKQYTPLGFRIGFRKFRWRMLYYLQSVIHMDTIKAYFCPVINKPLRRFVSIGNKKISPELGARSRHRFIWHYLKNHTELIGETKSLLHISPEYCFYRHFVDNKRHNYSPVDKFTPGYDYLPMTKDFDLLGSDMKDMYDYIICNHVLEHIDNDRLAIANLFTLLKSGGVAYVSVPIRKSDINHTYENDSILTPSDRAKHFGQWDHVRYYGLDIVGRFEKAGFSVEILASQEYFSPDELGKYGVDEHEYLFIMNKDLK